MSTTEDIDSAAVAAPESFWKRYVAAVAVRLERMPWLLPALSFGWGWLSFAMVRRGEEFARPMAVLALVGWPWLLAEPFIRKYLEKLTPGKLTKLAIDFVTQALQQELLFFSLPFVIGATQLDIGQWLFAATAIGAALISTIDPIYNRIVAPRPLVKQIFHAYCSWLAALVVLPMVVHLPLERAAPAALIFVIAWFTLTLGRSLQALPDTRQRALWLGLCAGIPAVIWICRDEIPAAGLSARDACITQSIADLTPGTPVTTLSNSDLSKGIIAFVAIRAPMGLTQSLVFEWRHNGDVERIGAEIRGGSRTGYRTWSRKMNFPSNAQGKWTVDVRTPQGQLLKRLHFRVM
ncbi:MAG TPA: DUF5924 family protein [Spongiibacteraceae bacterium]|nr:DUF5924 family protein [Spongiibacteraceae bacterium]